MLNNLVNDLRSKDWVKHLLRHANVYVVGGCVRDAMMKTPLKDIDIVVEGIGIDDVKVLLKHFGKSSLVGQSFSVIKFRPEYHEGEDFDIAVPRVDRKIGTGHKGFEVSTEGVTIKEDLKRRDFTVNSIAVNLRTNEILDPFGGRRDLAAKVLRATDKNAFVEDPLRIVRAIQFASRFRFDIEEGTLALMKRHAKLIKEISGERIKEEFDKILKKHGSTQVAFDLIEQSDLDKALFGEKFTKDGFEYFDDLDLVSFYFVLGNLGHKVPWKFYKERLKGDLPVTKALMAMEKHFDAIGEGVPEDQRKWNVFLMLKSSPMTLDSKVLPMAAKKIIKDMKAGKIPMKEGDIPVNGNDIMDKFGVKDEEVGNIKNQMYKDALMNKFDWKNKQKTLKYLETI